MDSNTLKYLADYWVWVFVLGVWGYFMIKYFMNEIKRKDDQNQSNLDKFIQLHEKTMDVVAKFSWSIDSIHPKLNEMHEDIKLALPKTKGRKTV